MPEDVFPMIKRKAKSVMDVRRNFSGGGGSRHFAYPFQVADHAMQMDVHKTLYPFNTTKKMPHVTATILKNAHGWQQCFFFTHTSFHIV